MAKPRKRHRDGRRSRRASRQERLVSPLAKIPFRRLRNPYRPLEILDDEGIEQLHQASLHILQEIGLDFFDDEALDLWREAGARVDDASRHAWLDGEMVLELVAKAPAEFQWRARNPERSMRLGGAAINFLPAGGMVYMNDLEKGRRPGTAADYADLLKTVQISNVMHGTGVALVELNDVPVSVRHLRRMMLKLTLSDKPVMTYAHGRIIPADAINMARMALGEDDSDDAAGPLLGGIINANSPLRYDERMLGGLITLARAGQATIITPFIVAGAMSPVTIAGALTQQNAEVLAGVALTQLVRPGAPTVYGGFCTNADMRSGSPAFGTPESAWVQLAGTQLARRYKLPSRGNGGLTNANLGDAQAASESMWSLWPAVMGHTNFIMHSAGWLEAGLAISPEKMLLDMENLAVFQHFLEGFEIDEETLALDMMAEVGPGGHHFGTEHTRAHYRGAFYEPFLSSRLGWEAWQADGSQDSVRRAHQLWRDLLARYEAPPLDPAIGEALEEYVARREHELEGQELYL